MKRLPFTSIPRPHAGATAVNLVMAAYLVCFANSTFWNALHLRISGHLIFQILIGISLFLLFNIFLSLVSFRPVHKPFLVVIIIASAFVSYFMDDYGVVVDKQMIGNIMATDLRESLELLTWPLIRHLFLFGVLPSALLIMTRIDARPWRRELLQRGFVLVTGIVLLTVVIMADFKEFALFYRNNNVLRMYVNPTYPIYSLIKKAMKAHGAAYSMDTPKVVAPDAMKPAASHKVVVLVIGETARAREFSLNGYRRQTNPELSTRNIYNFSDVQSCGTDTETSVPCMFSHLGKTDFSRDKAKGYENLLDIIKRTGVDVVWRDNNSGSKGVADRIPFQDMSNSKDAQLCASGECYDEILLKDLEKELGKSSGDSLIVLHQKGSHGPSYYKRSPRELKVFLPECTQDNVQDCDRQNIVNSYDNSIVYTDFFLSKLIDTLKAQPYPTAMLYISDHGESLGENNLYLHGLPYLLAPAEQTHVPMIFWASSNFLKDNGIDRKILVEQKDAKLSHDNLFHSMLGLFHIKTSLYRPDLDIFHSGRI